MSATAAKLGVQPGDEVANGSVARRVHNEVRERPRHSPHQALAPQLEAVNGDKPAA